MVVLIALLFIPGLRQTLIVDYVILGVLAVLLIEGWFTGRRVLRLVEQRYPGESTRGVRLYAAMRSTQIRKMRMPPPRVEPRRQGLRQDPARAGPGPAGGLPCGAGAGQRAG